MVDCNACGEKGLSWDNEYFENAGKWRLWSPQKERPHMCNNKIKEKKHNRKISCPKCATLGKARYIPEDKFQEHIQKEHIDWGDYR